jgi:hypothetical protein
MLTAMGGFALLGVMGAAGGLSGSGAKGLRVFILLWAVLLLAQGGFALGQDPPILPEPWRDRALGFVLPAGAAALLLRWIARPPRPARDADETEDEGYDR